MIVTTFDTETTGLLKHPYARVIEIGLVKHDIETGEIIETSSFLVKPQEEMIPLLDFSIPLKICGITKDEIMDTGIPYREAMWKMCDFIGRDLLWAWNLPFDMRMIMRFIEDGHFYGDKDDISHLEWTRHLRWGGCWQNLYAWSNVKNGLASRFNDGNIKTISMAKTMKIEGWEGEQQHRALGDALLAAKIGHKLFNQLNK